MISSLCLIICRHAFFSTPVFLLFIFTLDLVSPALAFPGEWRVTPIRLVLERGARSGVINVQNDSDAPMNFQVQGMEWIQDEKGKDQYTETTELIYFPKQLVIPPKEERVLRVGIKGGNGAREKTYRLFIEEVSPPRKETETEKTQIAVAIRFAVPLFIRPAKEVVTGDIIKAELHKGSLDATLSNTGNVHFRIRSIALSGMNSSGETIFTQEINGWYLLSGTSRTYSFAIPENICSQLSAIDIQAQTDRISFSRKMNAGPDMCTAQ
jgi:fimbrial chaperone protein